LNYLVHLYLAGKSSELQLGGLMGDFVKGPIPQHYPEEIRLGIRLHRRIDSLSSTNRHTRNSRQNLNPRLGHGRGVVVDIFYDHFLAAHWNEFHPTPLEIYAQEVYALLQTRFDELPSGLQTIAPRMIEYDWLTSYQHQEVVGKALYRIAQRLSRPLPLETAVYDLTQNEEIFRNDFQAFMAEAKEFSCQESGRNLYQEQKP
jgi:acyl carrier protein phosphodiesterase